MKKFSKRIRYYLEYLGFLLFIKIIRSMDIDKSSSICSYIARKIGPTLKVTDIARKNIHDSLGNNINAEEMIDELWDNFGRFIGEFPHLIDITDSEVNKRIELVGEENIADFQSKNQPFLIFSGHFANWDFIISNLKRLYPKFGLVYRRANNHLVDKVISQYRSKENMSLIAKGAGGAKDLVRCIKSNYSIAMLVDQKMNDGIPVPFFGRKAMTSQGIAKLALQFNYPIVPCQIIRKKGCYFKQIIYPPLSINKTGDDEKDCYNIMLEINQIFEKWIIQNPSQWFWFHNRWGK